MRLHNIVNDYWCHQDGGDAPNEIRKHVKAALSADELQELGLAQEEEPDWGVNKCSNNTKWHMLAFLHYV
jgi:hypothetical protein